MRLYWTLFCQVLLVVEVHNTQEKVAHREQNKAGRLNYWFKSEVSEPGRGFSQYRTEMRKGDTVNGQYEYSDGHVRVRVDYTADRAGYRVIKEERIPLKNLNISANHHQH